MRSEIYMMRVANISTTVCRLLALEVVIGFSFEVLCAYGYELNRKVQLFLSPEVHRVQ